MKRLMFLLIGMLLLAIAANAAPASISLYVVEDGKLVSNKSIIYTQVDTVGIYYVKGLGYDLGKTLEFKLELSTIYASFGVYTGESGVEWGPLIKGTLGDIRTGVIIWGDDCMGVGQDIVYLGQVRVFNTDPYNPMPKFTLRVTDYPSAEPPGIYMTRCDSRETLESVIGGTFYFNCGDCGPIAVKPITWGMIKSLF